MLDPLTTLRLQRFWDWFSGDDLNSYWSKVNYSGTGTFTMVDAVDEGFSVTTASDTNARNSGIEFNNKKQYSSSGSVFITVFRTVTASNNQAVVGLVENAGTGGDYYIVINRQGSTFYGLQNRNDASGTSTTDTTISVDTSFHSHKGTIDGTTCTLTIDGVLGASTTSNVPDENMEPEFNVLNHTSAQANEARIRYYEAYNT